MEWSEILTWLKETDEVRLQELFRLADETRARHVGDAVHLSGLLELSNHCFRSCLYCGIRGGNHALERFRMTSDEIIEELRPKFASIHGLRVFATNPPAINVGGRM